MGVKRGRARVRGEGRGGGMAAILQNSTDAYSWGQAEGLEMKDLASGWAHWRLSWDRRALG